MIYYGYKMVNGEILADEEQAQKLRQMYADYASGCSLCQCGERAGLQLTHRSIGLMLKNERYLGNAVYPRLIEPELFEEVQKKREERGRTHRKAPKEKQKAPEEKYTLKYVPKKYSDPYRQAEYAYSLIKTTEVKR